MISLKAVPKIFKFIERESRMVVTRGWGVRRRNGELLNEYKVSAWEDMKHSED